MQISQDHHCFSEGLSVGHWKKVANRIAAAFRSNKTTESSKTRMLENVSHSYERQIEGSIEASKEITGGYLPDV